MDGKVSGMSTLPTNVGVPVVLKRSRARTSNGFQGHG
jgi:hypothetical protein